jgi:hypothetical protein
LFLDIQLTKQFRNQAHSYEFVHISKSHAALVHGEVFFGLPRHEKGAR